MSRQVLTGFQLPHLFSGVIVALLTESGVNFPQTYKSENTVKSLNVGLMVSRSHLSFLAL